MPNLFFLSREAAALDALIAEHAEAHEGDLTDVLATIDKWAAELSVQIEAKLEAIARVIRNREAIADARREEAARLTHAARHDDNAVERLKSYAKDCLTQAGIRKVTAGPFVVSVQTNGGKNPVRLLQTPEDILSGILPTAIVRQTPSINMEVVRGLLEGTSPPIEGFDVSSIAELLPRGESLRIR